MNILFGWARGEGDGWCATNPRDVARMLCGRKRAAGAVPDQQPAGIPENLHQACRELLVAELGPIGTPVTEGVCPTCGGDVPVRHGRVGGHFQWVVGRAGPVQSNVWCDGEGEKPEAQS